MQIKLHSTLATPTASGTPGTIIDLPDSQAADLVSNGYASPVDTPDARRRRPADPAPAELIALTAKAIIALDLTFDVATAMLDLELAAKKPRSTVVEHLTDLLGQPDEGGDQENEGGDQENEGGDQENEGGDQE